MASRPAAHPSMTDLAPTALEPATPAEAAVHALIGLRWVPTIAIVLPLALVRYFRHQCLQWAAALAYYTLIGLVPLLAALFALLKGAGLHYELTPYIVNTVGAGSPRIAGEIIAFIDETNVRAAFGILSGLAALLAAIGIFLNAEMCFNAIWGGVRGRPFGRKLRSFAKMIIAGPLLLSLALALTALLRPGGRARAFFDSWYLGDLVLWLLTVLPYALLWTAFTFLYTRLPNTTVSQRSALIGAVTAGTLWQLAQFGYVRFVIRLVRYSAVYGTLWQIPILLAWVYVGWTIILFGAEISRAYQEVRAERFTPLRLERPAPGTARAE